MKSSDGTLEFSMLETFERFQINSLIIISIQNFSAPKIAPTLDYTTVPTSIDPCRSGLFNSLMGKFWLSAIWVWINYNNLLFYSLQIIISLRERRATITRVERILQINSSLNLKRNFISISTSREHEGLKLRMLYNLMRHK